MEHIYSSIDIGSDTIKLVVCSYNNNHLNLLSAVNTPAKGIKRGLIVNPRLASECIKNAFDETEQMLGIRINKVIASVPSYFADYTVINGSTKVDEVVTNKNIVDTFKMGIKKEILPDREFVNVVPMNFVLDGSTVLKDPKGKRASNLEARAIMVTSPKKNVYSVVSILENLGIEIVDISTSSIGDVYSFKNDKILSNAGIMVNIGAQTTTISLYNKGVPLLAKVINVGGIDIDKEIAYTYKVSMDEAKKIKEKFALAYYKNADVNNVYEVHNFEKKKLKIIQPDVSKIVNSKLEEILENVKEEINSLTNKLLGYIIITGGVSNLEDIEYLVQKVFIRNVSIGQIKLIGARNNKYSTAIGNIMYFIETLKLKGRDYTMVSRNDMEILKEPDMVKNEKDTMIDKVFGYFFGE